MTETKLQPEGHLLGPEAAEKGTRMGAAEAVTACSTLSPRLQSESGEPKAGLEGTLPAPSPWDFLAFARLWLLTATK